MSSEFTRRSHLLNSSIQVGHHSASRSEESYASRLPSSGALSKYLSSRSTEADATNNDDFKSYDSLLRRIRAEQADALNPNTSTSYLGTSPSRYTGAGASDGPRESFLHSRHQELMRARRQLDNNSFLGAGGGSLGVDQQQQQQQQGQEVTMNTGENSWRPTYSVRNIPVRSLEEVRETIAIRRQYYRERLFGKNEDPGGESSENADQVTDNGTAQEQGDSKAASDTQIAENAEHATGGNEEIELSKSEAEEKVDNDPSNSAQENVTVTGPSAPEKCEDNSTTEANGVSNRAMVLLDKVQDLPPPNVEDVKSMKDQADICICIAPGNVNVTNPESDTPGSAKVMPQPDQMSQLDTETESKEAPEPEPELVSSQQAAAAANSDEHEYKTEADSSPSAGDLGPESEILQSSPSASKPMPSPEDIVEPEPCDCGPNADEESESVEHKLRH